MAFATSQGKPDAPRPHTKWGTALGLGILGSLAVALILLAFTWPSKTSEPQNLPVSIAGPEAAVTAFEDLIDTASPGLFDFVEADDRGDAVDQIKTRETYGAIILAAPPEAPEVLTAPAANAAATQMLTGVATQLQTQLTAQVTAAGGDPSTATVTVTPVVPLAESDPTGAGLAVAALPLTIGGMLGGVLVSMLIVGPMRRLLALVGFATASGLLLTLILQTWFEYLQGDFWLNSLGIGVSILATAAFIAGCTSLIGPRGLGVAAAITILFANPLSGAAMPWQFLPEPWGAIGQYFVPGAANDLLRSLSYFPDANTAPQWLILSAWIAFGVMLTLVGHYRTRSSVRAAENPVT
ncbi:hypothetical protein [Microbacterium sp. NPDC090014]|uniref:hypothetical protein n=1 Tax=Microbacterium sp. NPDC090014 TaxID=3364205 RepID=UPI00381681AB